MEVMIMSKYIIIVKASGWVRGRGTNVTGKWEVPKQLNANSKVTQVQLDNMHNGIDLAKITSRFTCVNNLNKKGTAEVERGGGVNEELKFSTWRVVSSFYCTQLFS